MRHRLYGVYTCRLSGLRNGDEHPAYTPLRNMAPFTCTTLIYAQNYLRLISTVL